ncbi:MAG: hypothetical protein ABR878_14190 [Roseiarcus sp.]
MARIALRQRLVVFAERQAFPRQRRTIGDGVDDLEFVVQLPVAASRIDRARELPTRAPSPIGAEPFGNQLDDNIGERADPRQEQDDETPGHEAPGLGGMHDQRDVEDGDDDPSVQIRLRMWRDAAAGAGTHGSPTSRAAEGLNNLGARLSNPAPPLTPPPSAAPPRRARTGKAAV